MADRADEMHMVIVVMSFGTFVLAKSVAHRIISRRYRVNDALVHKGLQGTVNGNPVEFLPGLFFDIAMRERAGVVEEQLQDLFPAFCDTQFIALERSRYDRFPFAGCFHCIQVSILWLCRFRRLFQ